MQKITIIRYKFEKMDKMLLLGYLKMRRLSIRQYAKILGISPAYLSDILNGNRYASQEMLHKI